MKRLDSCGHSDNHIRQIMRARPSILKYILPILGVLLITSACLKEHQYVYSAKTALYTDSKNKCTVKYLGPKKGEIKSSQSITSESELRVIFTELAGTSSYSTLSSKFIGDVEVPTTDWHTIPYNEFTFGLLHIEYWDRLSELQKHETVDYFVDPRVGTVLFQERPERFDITYIQDVMRRAVPE